MEVTRIVHRLPRHGFEKECEELVRGMLAASAEFPGYLFSVVIPPRQAGEEIHIIQKF